MSDTSPLSQEARQITQLLHAWREGDSNAFDHLMPLVYQQLRSLALHYVSREQPGHTLNATALVHEAYLRICGAEIAWADRVHFFAVAAQTMRRILVDHARTAKRAKRGNGVPALLIETAISEPAVAPPKADILDLDNALTRLSQQDERKAKIVEMVYFGGLNCDEAATVLNISVATVNRDLQFARAWLRNELASA